MRRNAFFQLLLLLFCTSLNSQNLPTQNNYWQQTVNYKISVALNDTKHELNALETLEYINNSPDILKEIYFHLWPNAYKDNGTALVKQMVEDGSTDLYFAPPEQRGFIDELDFKINDKQVKWVYDSLNIDICKLILNEPLHSGEKITITTPFHVKIPSARFSRLGHIGQAYYITQWYPKPAVYDQFGWHPIPFLNQGEFYSEFGSFDVSITVPKNYVVGATGDLQDEDETKWLNSKVEETLLLNDFPDDLSFPKSDTATKTITYTQSRVHDFAWIADKRFHVLKSEVELPHTKTRVTTWALFTNAQSKMWTHATSYIDSALYYYSLWNGDYPYKNCTAVDGTIAAGGGMEYPNITIIGTASSDFDLEDVIVHEVGHNWFYGILGSNERDHAWMDEGINSFKELRYVYTKIPASEALGKNDLSGISSLGKLFGTEELNFKKAFMFEYLLKGRLHNDQPVDISSSEYTLFNYGIIVYRKTALIFDYLKSYLGDSLFDACMQEYYNKWRFKHPYPQDIRKIFESGTGKNLSWFFEDLLETTKKIDYKISGIHPLAGENTLIPTDKNYRMTIVNRGDIVAPFSYSVMKNGEIIDTKWLEGFSGRQQIQVACAGCDKIIIDNRQDIPEINQKNNSIKTKGLFRKMEPLELSWLGKVENPEKTQLFFTPVIGWNNYNKTMAGMAVYNKFLPNKNFEYILMPMYSFGTNNLAGSANINYSIYPRKGFLQRIKLSSTASHYAYNYEKVNADDPDAVKWHFTSLPVDFNFALRKKYERSTVEKLFSIRNIHTWQDQSYYDGATVMKINKYLFYNRVSFELNNKRTFDPYSLNITLENGTKYMKSNFEFNYRFSYKNVSKGVDIRFFAGAFLYNNGDDPTFNYRMNAKRGYEDYTYDNIYLGRSETEDILSKQMYIRDGGFKIYTAVGQSDKWIAAMNIQFDLPAKLPMRFFFDVGTNNYYINGDIPNYKTVAYDAGISVYLIKNVAEVYFPLFRSTDIKESLASDKYKEQIRFVLNFNLMDPFRLRDNLLN
jgi:hypothetical protein